MILLCGGGGGWHERDTGMLDCWWVERMSVRGVHELYVTQNDRNSRNICLRTENLTCQFNSRTQENKYRISKWYILVIKRKYSSITKTPYAMENTLKIKGNDGEGGGWRVCACTRRVNRCLCHLDLEVRITEAWCMCLPSTICRKFAHVWILELS